MKWCTLSKLNICLDETCFFKKVYGFIQYNLNEFLEGKGHYSMIDYIKACNFKWCKLSGTIFKMNDLELMTFDERILMNYFQLKTFDEGQKVIKNF